MQINTYIENTRLEFQNYGTCANLYNKGEIFEILDSRECTIWFIKHV